MAEKGRIEKITETTTKPADKDFKRSGIEGRKSAGKEEEE